MTDILELFSGVGIVIDDQINEKAGTPNGIQKIVASLQEKNIPLVKYEELPDDDMKHFKSISFVLLDWNLCGISPIPQATIDDNIDFLRKLKSQCFCPIFIFSEEAPDAIIATLEENKLYSRGGINTIFVKRKDELDTSDKLFSAIKSWLQNTPAMYVLKEWGMAMSKAQNQMFVDFYELNPNWVNVLFATSQKDGVDFSYEVDELLFNNLHTRIEPLSLDSNNFNPSEDYKPEEIRKVIQGQLLLGNKNLLSDMIFTGDIYKKDGEYYVNVRPQCDCILRSPDETVDDVKLYLIKGLEKDVNKCSFNKSYGTFSDIENRVTIFPVYNKAIQFMLGDFSIEKYGTMKNYRIGRLLPPYITRLVQKHALYMQRQGLPRLPEEATK